MAHQCMRIMQTNLVNVNLVTDINKTLKTLFNTNLTSCIQCTCASINGLNNNWIDNSNMVKLNMEPKNWIITIHNYCLTSYSISCRHVT